jgi:serine/threonine protein kinase
MSITKKYHNTKKTKSRTPLRSRTRKNITSNFRQSSIKKSMNFTKCDESKNCIVCDPQGKIQTFIVNGKKFEQVEGQDDQILLGSGARGHVYKFKHGNDHYALKKFFALDQYLEEVGITYLLQTGGYPSYVVPSYYVISNDCLFQIMHCKHDTLELLINRNKLTVVQIKQIYNDVLDGLIDLLEHGFLYSDLKPENILYSKVDHHYKIYLGDIGGITCIKKYKMVDFTKWILPLKYKPKYLDHIKILFENDKSAEIKQLVSQLESTEIWDKPLLKALAKPMNIETNKNMQDCLFTYPTINYGPILPFIDENRYKIFSHFLHQIVIFYMMMRGNTFLNTNDFYIYRHDLINKNKDRKTFKTELPPNMLPYFMIQEDDVRNLVKKDDDLIDILHTMKME